MGRKAVVAILLCLALLGSTACGPSGSQQQATTAKRPTTQAAAGAVPVFPNAKLHPGATNPDGVLAGAPFSPAHRARLHS